MQNIGEVIESIDARHCGYLLYLQCFIDFGGKIVIPSHEQEPMTKADIQRTVGLKRTAFYEFFKAMTDNDIIYEKDDAFYINERYHLRGKTDSQRYVKSFIAKVRQLYRESNAKNFGFIYKLLPYVHYETNTICANPFESNVEDIVQLTKRDIAALAGEDESTVYRRLRSLKLGDEFVFAEIRSGNARFYKLNPFIFYRKNGEPDATLREIFRLGYGR